MNIEQIRSTDGTGTLSYIISDESSSAALIDPNIEDVDKIASRLRENDLTLTHIFDTHTHADHVSGAAKLKELFGAKIIMHENTKNKWKIVEQGDKFGIGEILRENAAMTIDRYVQDNDEVHVGGMYVKIIFTPGHTDNHITLQVEGNIFTGDLLLIGQAGRSDLPGGNTEEQYESIVTKILQLADTTKMYPGHDYGQNVFSYLGDEKKTNPFLRQKSKEEYLAFVQNYFPPLADASASGGKVVLQCGTQRVAQPGDAFKTITAKQLHSILQEKEQLLLLDVREPEELAATGTVDSAVNISIRQLKQRTNELPDDKSTPVITICASGSRSAEAAHALQQLGYTNVSSVAGGTLGWINDGLPVVRPMLRNS